jgi:hypothetical protein
MFRSFTQLVTNNAIDFALAKAVIAKAAISRKFTLVRWT